MGNQRAPSGPGPRRGTPMLILKRGDLGDDVRRLQHLLNTGLKPSPGLPANGKFGPRTEEAVKLYQRSHGLKDDGIVGPKTWTALGQQLTVTPAPPVAPAEEADAPWMAIAQAEDGVHENSLPGQHNQRIVEYLHTTTNISAAAQSQDETAWCSAFVNRCLQQVGIAGTNHALASSWLNWGVPLTQARRGAITVVKKKGANADANTGSGTGFHVAFLVSETPSTVRLLGGNQGGGVKVCTVGFSLASYEVKGYRWPAAG